MSRDVVIDWQGRAPARTHLEEVLRLYFGSAADVAFAARGTWWRIRLPGTISFPYLCRGPATRAQRAYWKEAMAMPQRRTIEVWPYAKNLYVLTREADPFTTDLADALAARLARVFRGRIRPT